MYGAGPFAKIKVSRGVIVDWKKKQYAIESQIQWHGLDPEDALVTIFPEGPRSILTTEQIFRVIDENASTASIIFLSGVQYYTGQVFDIKAITKYAQSRGIVVGWDFAHGVGNIVLDLHEWGVDFAAWCSYKYLCSGPGGIGGIFVHEKHASPDRHRLAGWWGHDRGSRFDMENGLYSHDPISHRQKKVHCAKMFSPVFNAIPGAAGYQLSNPSILDLTALLASLALFSSATMPALRTKSVLLTGYLEHLLNSQFSTFSPKPFTILTPFDPNARGAQLSLLFSEGLMMLVFDALLENGVVVDERKPDVIRVAPCPLYNSFSDVWQFVQELRGAVEGAQALRAKEGVSKREVDIRENGPRSP